MAVPAEPNAEGLANLIQAQGQGQEQPLAQDQQLQAQEQQLQAQPQQPPAPPGAAAAQVQVGEVFCFTLLVLFFVALCCTSTRLLPLCGVQFLLFLCLRFTPVTGSLIYMFTTCFAKFCHLCVTLYCRPARLCVSYLRNNLVVCSTREVCSCVRAEKEFGRVLDLIESLVVCLTRERVWSCV